MSATSFEDHMCGDLFGLGPGTAWRGKQPETKDVEQHKSLSFRKCPQCRHTYNRCSWEEKRPRGCCCAPGSRASRAKALQISTRSCGFCERFKPTQPSRLASEMVSPVFRKRCFRNRNPLRAELRTFIPLRATAQRRSIKSHNVHHTNIVGFDTLR